MENMLMSFKSWVKFEKLMKDEITITSKDKFTILMNGITRILNMIPIDYQNLIIESENERDYF